MYLYLEFPFKTQHHCGELVVKIYYIVQENIGNLKQNILCNKGILFNLKNYIDMHSCINILLIGFEK